MPNLSRVFSIPTLLAAGFGWALSWTGVVRAQQVSEIMPRVTESLLLDADMAGDRVVVVGERGHIVVSDDDGRTWKQVQVPTREMLTGVSFSDAAHGIAVGHHNTILVTNDRGNTWSLRVIEPEYDVIFMDVLMLNNDRGFAIGAYGEFWDTFDGGENWEQRFISDFDYHHNEISVSEDGTLYVAGESGSFLTSRDRGETWEELDSPYYGSYHGVLPVGANRVFLYGLRGHIFLSRDRGKSWINHSEDAGGIVSAGARIDTNTLLLAGQGGHFFISHDNGESLANKRVPELDSIVEVLLTPEDTLIVVGNRGITRYSARELERLLRIDQDS